MFIDDIQIDQELRSLL